MDIINDLVVIISILAIALGLIILVWWLASCKIRKTKINNIDYKNVKEFYNNKLKKNHPNYDHNCYAAADYLETIEYVCEEFLKGHKNLGEEKEELINDLKESEIINEMKKLKLDFLKKDIKAVLITIYNYYDDRGIWKRNN